jgi:hypothetical protein
VKETPNRLWAELAIGLCTTQGDVYIANVDGFERAYGMVSRDMFETHSSVWAEQAETAGAIETKEGSTHYCSDDYPIFNVPGRQNGYAIAAETFHSQYEPSER